MRGIYRLFLYRNGVEMIKYYEKRLQLENKIDFEDAANLYGDSEYCCLYENGDEITVGVGAYSVIHVTQLEIIMDSPNESKRVKLESLCEDMEKALGSIKLADWRMYGIANFAVSRYVYGLNTGKETGELFRFFIPQMEYRIKDNEITLRAMDQTRIPDMEALIQRSRRSNQITSSQRLIDSGKVIQYDEEYYKDIVSKGIGDIKNGKYQKIILSRKIPLEHRLDMRETYISGRNANTPARSYLCRLQDFEVVGFSPETVAEVEKNRTVYTFPLAGTRALTSDSKLNKELKHQLLNDPKEIAEHAISVKLAFEEMEQVCEPSSVSVIDYMSVMERGTVQHLGSRLKGKLKDGYNSWHALCKLFPAVTASGIPKKEAIEAIGKLEKEARDLYSGSVLIYDSDGSMDAALVLRSIFQSKKESWVRVGAGIVELSNPTREFIETQEKVSCIAKNLILEAQLVSSR